MYDMINEVEFCKNECSERLFSISFRWEAAGAAKKKQSMAILMIK